MEPRVGIASPRHRGARFTPRRKGAGVSPLAQTSVAMRTFSFPSWKRWMMSARWATVRSAIRMATWCPSRLIAADSRCALLRVRERGERRAERSAVAPSQPFHDIFPPPALFSPLPESPAPFEGAPGAFSRLKIRPKRHGQARGLREDT